MIRRIAMTTWFALAVIPASSRSDDPTALPESERVRAKTERARGHLWQESVVAPRAGTDGESLAQAVRRVEAAMKAGGQTPPTPPPPLAPTTQPKARPVQTGARPGPQADAAKWGKWKKIYYVGTEPGKPIRLSDVPKIASVKLLRTGEAVDYSYENGVLILPNPAAGPDGLHEVIELVLK